MNDRDLRLREIFLLATAIYAVWTPLYFALTPEPIKEPATARVILPVGHFDDTGRVAARGFGFKQHSDDAKSVFVIYENSTPLPEDHYELAPFNAMNKWREVKFTSSDGSDPRDNGRRYYAVIPRCAASCEQMP